MAVTRARSRTLEPIVKRGELLTPRQYLDNLMMKSMRVLDDILDTGEPREQVDATRVVTSTWAKVREFEQQLDLPKFDQIRRALNDPDDDLLRALRAEREKVLALLGQPASGVLDAGQQPESNSSCHDTSTQIDKRKP